MSIQDIIGAAKLWPAYIRTLFWSRNVKYFSRAVLAAFVYINGLNPEIFIEWVELRKICRDKSAKNHFKALFSDFESGKYVGKHTLYGYNVAMGQYEYIDGCPCHGNRSKDICALLTSCK
jgi:hypothetical protein